MASKKTNIRGKLGILGLLGSGTGDPLLTRNTSTKEVGTVPAQDPSSYLSTTLAQAKILIGSSAAVATARDVSGAITISDTGVTAIASNYITNNHISTTAAIARTKIASGTAYRIAANNASGVLADAAAITATRLLVSDANGIPTHTSVTTTEAGYISGVTSAIQTQLNNRLSFSSALVPATGDVITYSGGVWTRLAIGTAAQVLTVSGGLPAWAANSGISGLTANRLTYATSATAITTDANIVRSTLADQIPHVAFSGTMPAVITGTSYGTSISYTSAGSSSQINGAANFSYAAGYTGSSTTVGVDINNNVAGIGGILIPASNSNATVGNHGARSTSTQTTTGYNFGIRGSGGAGNVNVGVAGIAQISKNSATNFGVVGSAINTGTSGLEVGGWFSLNQQTIPTVSAALIADNGSQASPIILGMDNGVTVFTVDNGGNTTIVGDLVATNLQATNLSSGKIVTTTSSGLLAVDTALLWDATNNSLTIGDARFVFTTSLSNIFIGEIAGNFTTTGFGNNIGIGGHALRFISSGQDNVALGSEALGSITTQSQNVALGAWALSGASNTGTVNVGIGYNSLLAITSGSQNIAIGGASGTNITTGSNNIIIGASVSAQSATTSNQLSIQNIIFGTGNSATGTSVSTGSIGIGVATSLGARLHVKGENNTSALLVEDDSGNDIFVAGETGGARVFGFFGSSAVQQTSGANLTNNVTSGGSNDVIADFTSLTVYSTDAGAIRNDIYQLARKLKQINDGLRTYGIFT